MTTERTTNGHDDARTMHSAIMRELDELRGMIAAEFGKAAQRDDAIMRVAERIAARQLEREHDEDRYRRRLKNAEEELERLSKQADGPNWQRDPRDITGVHHLREIEEWRQERRDSGIWWRRQRWTVAIGVAAALFVAAVSGCVTYAVSHVEVRK